LLPLSDGQRLCTEGATLRVIFTPGHTVDHAAFYLEEEQALFSGDCVLGHGTTVFDDLGTYMASLRRLQGLGEGGAEGGVKVIYPGHGAVLRENPLAVIGAYIAHREYRERQILGVLAGREGRREGGREGGKGGLTPLQIVRTVYEEGLPVAVVSRGWGGRARGREGGRVRSGGCWPSVFLMEGRNQAGA
jgi:hydrolase